MMERFIFILTPIDDELHRLHIYNMGDSQDDTKQDSEGDVSTITQEKIKRPSLYKVLMHNDDYTTMEFVVFVLQTVFGKTSEEAHAIMLKVHIDGMGVCGVFTYEVAETKVNKVERMARQSSHPLRCSFEPE